MNPINEVAFSVGNHSFQVSFRKGQDLTVVLLHGIGCSRANFLGVWEQSRLNKCGCCTFDLLGFGESSKDEAFSYDLMEHAKLLAAAIQENLQTKIVLIAHSVGGGLATFLLNLLGPRVVAFVSLEGNIAPTDCGLVTRRAASVDEQQFQNVLWKEFRSELVARGEDPRDFDRSLPVAYYRTARSTVRYCDDGTILKNFNQYKGARYYVFGELLRPAVASELVDTKIYSIPHAGHMMMLDNPIGFYSILTEIILTSAGTIA